MQAIDDTITPNQASKLLFSVANIKERKKKKEKNRE